MEDNKRLTSHETEDDVDCESLPCARARHPSHASHLTPTFTSPSIPLVRSPPITTPTLLSPRWTYPGLSSSKINHEKHQENLCQSFLPNLRVSSLTPNQLSRTRSSQDSNSSKKEVKYTNTTPTSAPPPPPPNNTKPLPPPGGSTSNPIHLQPGPTHPSSNSSPNRSPASSTHSTPDRRSSTDNTSPTPPIVVVSSDPSSDSSRHTATPPDRHPTSLDHGNATPPRTTRGLRPNQPPKDTIPMVGKPPRKQRSSRFVVTEKVEIERLPPFMGQSVSLCGKQFVLILSFKKRLPMNDRNFSSKNYTSVAFSLISTTRVQNSKANRSKRRHFTRCLNI